ncbi:50S ribosomal protein L29 [Candidatus Margulisiibacteriota bacterium]
MKKETNIIESKTELEDLYVQLGANKLKKTHLIKFKKKEIARILTKQNQKELSGEKE